MNWVETNTQKPTVQAGEQVKVMMYTPGWAGPIYGLYTHWCDGGEWAEYDQQNDCYLDFKDVPARWCKVTVPN